MFGAYDNYGGDRLVNPSVLFEEVADDDAEAEHGDEDGDGDDGGGLDLIGEEEAGEREERHGTNSTTHSRSERVEIIRVLGS